MYNICDKKDNHHVHGRMYTEVKMILSMSIRKELAKAIN
jgi:hypothetical protein